MRLKKLLTSTFILLSLMLGLCQPFAGLNSPASAMAETTKKDSLFLVDVSLVSAYKDKIYIYDVDDSQIKVVSGTTHKFEAENDRIAAENVNDMLFLDDAMIIYSRTKTEPETASLSAVNLLDDNFGQELLVSGDETLTTLSSAKSLQLVKCADQNYLCLYPDDPVQGQFEFAKIEKQENTILISEAKTFSISPSVGQGALIQTYDFARTFDDKGKFFIVFAKGNTLLSCSLDPTNPDTIASLSQLTLKSGTIDENILDFGYSKFYQAETDDFAILTSSNVSFWTLDMDAKTLTKSDKDDITFDPDFSITDTTINGSYIALIDNTAQALVIYDLGEQQFNVDGYTLDNGQVSETLYQTVSEYEYKKVKVDTPVKQTPYSSSLKPLVTAKRDHYVAVLGKGFDQDDKQIDGWDYVIYTENGVNYYGYVSTVDTMAIPTEEVEDYDKAYVTVLAYTKIYSLPTNVLDTKNVEVREIEKSSSARLKVLSTLQDYKTFGQNETSNKYLLVSVNGGQVGFIDRDRVLQVSSVTNRVVPNATVMRNNCKIFVSANDTGEALDVVLNKGYRVKVIGKRDTITNYTLITFNDEDGNELTGYIYTYNLEADSWNTVQFIGMFLVLLNVILLVVIICVKNEVTR